jgi:hypothetical protein
MLINHSEINRVKAVKDDGHPDFPLRRLPEELFYLALLTTH